MLRELRRQTSRASRAAGETAREKKLLVLAVGQGSHRRVPPAPSDLSFGETSQRRRQEYGSLAGATLQRRQTGPSAELHCTGPTVLQRTHFWSVNPAQGRHRATLAPSLSRIR
ncbi:hypothetical protein ALMP_73280 [Streptomyces sp. A012304]|nr:hypothetical protein ALMP_73280 [Streptomyces sp. A012304]